MGLSGDLHTMGLVDVLTWISERRKTGTLHVQRRSTRKRVIFREGAVYSSWSNDPREALGQFLIKDGLISEEDLFKALLRQEQQRKLLGAILVAEGTLTPQQLKRALRANAEDSVYDLFLWPDGRFEFQDEGFPRDLLINLELDTQQVIGEGNRRMTEWLRISERFPSSAVTFEARQPLSQIDALEPSARQMARLAASGKSLAEISLETRRSEYETGVALHRLCDDGLLEVLQASDEATATDVVGAIEELVRLGEQRFSERRYEAAVEAFEQVLTLDGLNQQAKKGLIAVAEAYKRERLIRRVPLEQIPVVRVGSMALANEKFDAHEGFVLSRINGQWNVRSILKLCPMPEEEALVIFVRLLERKVIELR
jgi:Domain of unknown function (DUF4388)